MSLLTVCLKYNNQNWFIKDQNIVEITDVLSMTVPGESEKVGDKIAGGFTETTVMPPSSDPPADSPSAGASSFLPEPEHPANADMVSDKNIFLYVSDTIILL